MTEARRSGERARLLYVGMTYDYGQPGRGFSYEYVNFLDTLRHMPAFEVAHFPVDVHLRNEGREGMNDALLRAVADFKPALCIFVLFTDEIASGTIEKISRTGGVTTLNWFGDDHWRFLPFSRHFAPSFHWVVTTDSAAVAKYRALGCRQVVKSQWGYNHHLVARRDAMKELDVTFVGQVHSRRREIVGQLRRAGIDIRCWGRGWENGRLGQEEMIAMYRRSRINLNFTESSVVAGWKPVVKCLLNRRADDTLHLNRPGRMFDHARSLVTARGPQIKGRNFEIPGAGGFLLTSHADNLDEYFAPGREIAIFSSVDDLISQIRHYLAHPDERERIRAAGHARALRDHTYERRFLDIFNVIGIGVETFSGIKQ